MPRKRRARTSCCGARRKSRPPSRPDGTLWLAWMAGGQISVASSNDAGRSFSTPVQVTKEKLNLDWGPDARPKIVVEKNGGIALAFSLFRDKAFNGQVLATQVGRWRQKLCRAEADHVEQREPAFRGARRSMLTVRCLPPGSTSATGCRRSRKARSTRGQGCSSRRRKTAARPIPRRGWQATTPASAAGSDLPSPVPAVPWSCSGTSLRAASGITRS